MNAKRSEFVAVLPEEAPQPVAPDGKRFATKDCPGCKGEGEFEGPKVVRICRRCGGTGSVPA